MKKNLFFVAAAALMLASCSNDVKLDENIVPVGSNKQQEISFFALSQKPNRKPAAAVTDNVFPTAYHFLIAAYAVDAAGDYFGKTDYANETSNTWSGVAGQKRYWPLSPETLNFLAVTKSDADGSNTTFGAGEPLANFASKAVVVLADNRTTQHDLMYSFARAAVTKDGNHLAFNGGSNVAMAFAHTQALVNFTVKAADAATAGAGIVVTGIQLKQAVYNGTATVTLSNYNSKTVDLAATLAWDGTAYSGATKYDVDVTSISNIAVNSQDAIAAGDGLMIVPNPTKTAEVLNPSFTTFVVSYTLNGHDYTFEYTPTDAQKRMEPGHKYNFNITFTLSEIKVNATVTDWTEGAIPVAIPEPAEP
jgi:hypothetical protein